MWDPVSIGAALKFGGEAFGNDKGDRRNKDRLGANSIFQLAAIPYLQMLGGLMPELQGVIGKLPQFQKFGSPSFTSPLEYGPFGSVSQQFDRARQAGRTGLASRGLLGSGAQFGVEDQLAMQEALANRQVLMNLLQQIPLGLNQALGSGMSARAGKQAAGAAGTGDNFLGMALGQILGGIGQGIPMGIGAAIPAGV